MDAISQLREYLQKQDVYDLDDVNEKFKEIADFLMNKCVVKVGTRKFRMGEIEFYLFSEKHNDIIAYPRTNMDGGEWFFHASGVDICFNSQCKQDSDGIFKLDEKKDKFGGILIRSIVELDDHLKPIGKAVVGPIKSMDVLFKKIDAFDREKSREQIAVIVEEKNLTEAVVESTTRRILVRNGNKAKVKTILSENYKIKDQGTIDQWVRAFGESLDYEWRFIVELGT